MQVGDEHEDSTVLAIHPVLGPTEDGDHLLPDRRRPLVTPAPVPHPYADG